MGNQIKLVKCPVCQRNFADKLHPSKGYVFPIHAVSANPERREKLRQCPGSLSAIERKDRVAA